MKSVDSNDKVLSIDQLLTIAAENTKSGYSSDTVLAFFMKEIALQGTVLLRYGNTLYVIHPSKTNKSIGSFRALNADVASNFLESGYDFVLDAWEKGFDILQTEFQDESILNLFRTVSKNPPREGMGYAVRRLPDNVFRVTLKLGNLRTEEVA